MTLHKEKTCACGHAARFHADGGKGACTYGHDKETGGCRECPQFHRRASPAPSNGAAVIPILDPEHFPMLKDVPVAPAEDPARFAMVSMIRALDAARASLVESVRAYDADDRRERVARFVREAPVSLSKLPKQVVATPPASSPRRGAYPDPSLKSGEQLMLITLAAYHTLTRAELGAMVGIRARGTTFQRYLSTLFGAGLVSRDRDRVHVTSEGLKLVSEQWSISPVKPSRSSVVERWKPRLKLGEGNMLDAVLSRGTISRRQLGDLTGIASSGTTFGRYLSTLKGADLVSADRTDVWPGPWLKMLDETSP